MKLLFVHGHEKIRTDQYGNKYTDGSYSSSIWSRYLDLCDELHVMFKKDLEIIDIAYAKQHYYPISEDIVFHELDDITSNPLSFVHSIFSVKHLKSLIEIIKSVDALILRLPSIEGAIVARIARKFKKPYLVEVVGCAWDSYFNHSFRGKIIAPFMWLNTRYAVKKSNYAVYVTNRFLQKRYPTDGKMLACSDVQIDPATSELKLQREKKVLNKPVLTFRIGTIGAYDVPYKGQRYVIEAISILEKEGYKIQYDLVGGGDNTALNNLISELNVKSIINFKGSLTRDQIYEFLDKLDIYIQPSETEGMPRSMIEAMSRGCLVMGSKIGGIPELIPEKFQFKVGSVQEICTILRQLSVEDAIVSAHSNFEASRLFEPSVLDHKRSSFYREFVQSLR